MDLEKNYQAYLKWKAKLLTPKDPQNDSEFATKHGLTIQDLVSFVERPSFQDDLLLASLTWAKSKTPELLHLVYNEVKLSKSVADLEKFIQIAHEVKKKDKDDKNSNNFFFFQDIKPEQYANIIAREAKFINSGSEE